MVDAVIGEIRMFAGAKPPTNWVWCDGQLLSVIDYAQLYNLLGTTWGGNGTTNFAVPDLRGRVPVGQGQGPNLTSRSLGQAGGTSQVALAVTNLPAHNHTFYASNKPATTPDISANVGLAQPLPSTSPAGQVARYVPPSALSRQETMDANAITPAIGSGQAHANLMPYLAIQYMICVYGFYPNRPNPSRP